VKPDCILLYGRHQTPVVKTAGVFRIATELRNHGYTVQCVDLSAFDESNLDLFVELLDHLISENTLWLGISTSFFNTHLKNDKEFLKSLLIRCIIRIKLRHPKLKLIAGGSGYWPTFEKLGFKIFKGYSDKPIIKFTDWCAGKISTYEYIIPYIESEEFKEFNQSKIEYTENDVMFPEEALAIEVSRGCIFRCKFCAYPLNGKTKNDHIKSYDVLFDEFLKNYEKFGITRYVLSDDTYNDSVDKVKGLYDNVYSKLPFKIELTGYLRLDLLARFPETAEYLKQSGFRSAVFGIETINEKSGKAIGKGMPPTRQFEFIDYLKNNEFKNVNITAGIILGLPYDTIDTLDETKEFLLSDKNKLDSFFINPLYIAPDYPRLNSSEFELEYEKYGYIFETDDNKRNPKLESFWKNTNTGLDFHICEKYSNDIELSAYFQQKNKINDFNVPWAQTIGIPTDEISNLSAFEIELKYGSSLADAWKKKYIEKLLKVTNFPKSIDN
jgi:hypothetical protein